MTTDKTALDALLPCPFCGGEAEYWHGDVAYGNYALVCKKCECMLHLNNPFSYPEDCSDDEFDELNKKALAKLWNTRPQPSGDAVKALDWCDLMVDEFMRIKSSPNVSDEIKQLCERAIKNTHQHLPVILQRDTLQRKVNELEHAALTQSKADVVVDLDSLKREVKKYLDSKVDGYWWDDIITYLHDKGYLAARGCFGVPEGYALVPIEKQFDGKTFRLVAAEYGCLQDISLTVRDMSVLKAAPKKEGNDV